MSLFQEKSLGEIADKSKKFSIVDGPFGTQLHADEYVTDGVPVVRVSNLSYEGTFLPDELVFITEKKAQQLARSKIIKDDLIIAKTGATIGKTALFPLEAGIVASSCLKVTFDRAQADPQYMLYRIMSDEGQRKILDGAGGSTRATINITPLSNIRFNLPPIDYQSVAANVINSIDQSIILTEAMIVKHQQIRFGITHDLLTFGIDDNGEIRDPATHEFKPSPFGMIPEEWKIEKLNENISVFGGKRIPKGHDYVDEITGFKYLRVVNFYKRKIKYSQLLNLSPQTYNLLEKYEISKGELFVSIAGSIGWCGVIDNQESYRMILTENAAKLRVENDSFLPNFLAYQFNGPFVQRQIIREMGIGGGVPKLALFRIENLLLVRPKNEEQKRILHVLDCLEFHERTLETQKKKFLHIKKGLIQDLFSGNVSINALIKTKG